MKKNFIFLFNIAFLILQITGTLVYMFVGNPYMWKTFASLTFLIGGIVNLVYVFCNKEEFKANSNFKYFMIIGLFFAMLGDILLIDYFIIGAALFAVGHVWYFCAYTTIGKVNMKDFLCSLAIFIVCIAIILFVPIFEYNGMLWVILIYAFVISIMLGKSVANYFFNAKNVTSLIIMIGSIMFFLSDMMLLFNVFGGVGEWADILCLLFYYPAQYLLAISICFASKNTAAKE